MKNRMIRKIIHIDAEKCNGCGACAKACHEGAIGMVNGKAVLLREDYCDGLGDCLPACPTGAITFEEREAPAYDAAAVEEAKKKKQADEPLPCGCPGSRSRALTPPPALHGAPVPPPSAPVLKEAALVSELRQWPVQIKLAPVNAPYFDGAKLLVAADCTAYAFAAFHQKFVRDHVTLIGCPKLDSVDYSEKLAEILRRNNVRSVSVVRMEVPCCGGIVAAVQKALAASGKQIPWHVTTISVRGEILEEL